MVFSFKKAQAILEKKFQNTIEGSRTWSHICNIFYFSRFVCRLLFVVFFTQSRGFFNEILEFEFVEYFFYFLVILLVDLRNETVRSD